MKKIILIFIILCFGNVALLADSGESKIDSILTHVDDYIRSVSQLRDLPAQDLALYIETAKEDIHRCKIYNALCWVYFNSDPPKAMEYAKLQYPIAEKLGVHEVVIASYDNMSWLYLNSSDYENAVSFMLKALKEKEAVNDVAGIAVSLAGLGGVYLNMNNFKLSLDYFNKAFEIEKKIANNSVEGKRRNAVMVGNIGLCHTELGDIDKGLEMYLHAVDLYKEAGLEDQASTTYSNIGLIYLNNKQDFDKALEYFTEAARFAKESGNVSLQASVYRHMSESYSQKNNFTKALIYAKKGVKYAGLSGDKQDILNANSNLAKIFYKNKNYQLAYEHFKIAFDLKDSIFNETSSNQIAEMQTKYDTEKKEAENSLLLAEKELDKAELDKKSTQQTMLLLGLFLALVIVAYVAYSLNQKKKTNKILNTQNEEISNKNAIIEEKNKNITDSINYAQRIQDAILPDEAILKNNYESFIYYRPKDIVSGDFYWIKEIRDKIFFSVVDCTGHGVPGAFMSIIGANSLNKIVEDLKIEKTGEILDELNNLVNKALGKESDSDDNIISVRDGMDISICVIDKKNNTLEYSGANNSLYFLRKSNNKIEGLQLILEDKNALFYEIKPNKMAIGGGQNKDKYLSHKIQLDKDDSIYLFSDGYADQFGGEKGKKFMYKRFKNMFLTIQNLTMDGQLEHLDETMENWKEDIDQLDDICVMGVRI